MRVVLQRVRHAAVTVDDETIAAIWDGFLALVGVAADDTAARAGALAEKTASLRVFADAEGRFTHDIREIQGAVLVVSQFTLFGDVRRGRRPSFADAAPPERAAPLVEAYAAALEAAGVPVQRGRFGAHMAVSLLNDGPVTILLDSADLERPRHA